MSKSKSRLRLHIKIERRAISGRTIASVPYSACEVIELRQFESRWLQIDQNDEQVFDDRLDANRSPTRNSSR